MSNFILIRSYRQEDEPFCKKLLKAGIIDSLNATFTAFLTRKGAINAINASIVMFTLALIIVGFPIVYCIMFIFIPPIIFYIFLYATFLYEARNVENEASAITWIYTSDNSSCFWIAEAYEDYSLNHQQNQRYIFMTEEKFNESNINVSRYVKKVVGTIAFYNCNRSPNSGWIKRLSVHKNYRRKGIGSYLVNRVLQFGEEQGFEYINVIISEYRIGAILLFIKKGFNMHNIHSKSHFMLIAFYEYVYRTTHYRPRY
ncbi:uncharacterized protein LOC124421626 [Vespa crabro]|uniref:uncharacterized protein LOC124421626 n=1 Tax=Vespa crabro TaxID=7445 RepID=UPI001F01DB2B|nr:uncharacterized protein LOC124421626 [Vespa crabro]